MKLELATRYCNILEILNFSYKIKFKLDRVNFYYIRRILFVLFEILLLISRLDYFNTKYCNIKILHYSKTLRNRDILN